MKNHSALGGDMRLNLPLSSSQILYAQTFDRCLWVLFHQAPINRAKWLFNLKDLLIRLYNLPLIKSFANAWGLKKQVNTIEWELKLYHFIAAVGWVGGLDHLFCSAWVLSWTNCFKIFTNGLKKGMQWLVSYLSFFLLNFLQIISF